MDSGSSTSPASAASQSPRARPKNEPRSEDPLSPLPLASFSFQSGGGCDGGEEIPQPLEALRSAPIPPFLSKTYELVDDPALDAILSWAPAGRSFVVWDPVEFARTVLPGHFKHNNFSSFVRQLNTYGFHKIDADRWEFANESFMKGKKHLLRNINRQRSYQAHQLSIQIGSSTEMAKSRLVDEIDMLKNDKRALLQEITSLHHENRTTIQLMNSLNQRMQSAEMSQKQMVSFLAKVLQSPELLDHLKQQKKHSGIVSSKARRKFLKLARPGSNDSTGSMDADASSSPPTLDTPDSILSDSIEKTRLQASGKSLAECLNQIQDNTLAPLFLETDIVSLVGNNADPNRQSLAFNGNNFAGLSPDTDTAAAASVSDHLISFPEGDLSVTDATIIDQEEVWKAITEAGPNSFSRRSDMRYGTTAQDSDMFDTATRFDTPLWDLDLQIFNQGFGDGDIVGFVDP